MTWLNWSCVGAFSNFHGGNCEEGKSFEEDKEKKKKKARLSGQKGNFMKMLSVVNILWILSQTTTIERENIGLEYKLVL